MNRFSDRPVITYPAVNRIVQEAHAQLMPLYRLAPNLYRMRPFDYLDERWGPWRDIRKEMFAEAVADHLLDMEGVTT